MKSDRVRVYIMLRVVSQVESVLLIQVLNVSFLYMNKLTPILAILLQSTNVKKANKQL